MPREVTYKVGLIGHEKHTKDVEGATQEITVQIHELEAAPWGVDAKLQYVGTEIPRLDGAQKATGAAKYTYDMNPPGLAFAGLVTSPHAHARVVKVDASAAKAMKGVLAVETMEGQVAKYPGKIVAAVCAESEGILGDALAAVKVTYEVLPAAAVTEDAMKDGAPQVNPQPNVRSVNRRRPRDASEAFAGAAATVKAKYRTAVQTHSCLEPHGCTVKFEDDGTVTIWASTQATAGFAGRRFLRELGVPRNRVRVITQHMGGGFGSKFGALEWDSLCAKFARETKRPVRMMLSRRNEHLVGGNRPDSIQTMELAGSKDGTFLGLRGETYGTYGNAASGGAGSANTGVYRFPVTEMRQNAVATHSARGAAFRAPRHPQGFYALESIIDRYAYAIGMDPLAVRLKNDPHPIRQVQWRIGAERIGWSKNHRKTPGSDKGVVKRGVGCASGRWGQAGRHMGFGGPVKVNCIVERDGSVAVESCVQDLGTGIRTVMAIMVAEELGVPPAGIDVRIGDSRYPPGPGSGGSTTSPTIAPVARNAALRAREAVGRLVAQQWGVGDADIAYANGTFKGPGGKSTPWAKACSLVGPDGLRVQGERRRNWESPYRETAGCQFAQVAVDTETGVVTVEKVVAIHDAGRIIDSMTARSQVNGGVIQGVSYALYEEKQVDRVGGDMVNPTFDTYRIMGIEDCPEIDVVLTSVDSGFNNGGIMGLGEPAAVPTAGAVANAVYNAIGVQVTELPMTPERVLAALEGGQK